MIKEDCSPISPRLISLPKFLTFKLLIMGVGVGVGVAAGKTLTLQVVLWSPLATLICLEPELEKLVVKLGPVAAIGEPSATPHLNTPLPPPEAKKLTCLSSPTSWENGVQTSGFGVESAVVTAGVKTKNNAVKNRPVVRVFKQKLLFFPVFERGIRIFTIILATRGFVKFFKIGARQSPSPR